MEYFDASREYEEEHRKPFADQAVGIELCDSIDVYTTTEFLARFPGRVINRAQVHPNPRSIQ